MTGDIVLLKISPDLWPHWLDTPNIDSTELYSTFDFFHLTISSLVHIFFFVSAVCFSQDFLLFVSTWITFGLLIFFHLKKSSLVHIFFFRFSWRWTSSSFFFSSQVFSMVSKLEFSVLTHLFGTVKQEDMYPVFFPTILFPGLKLIWIFRRRLPDKAWLGDPC